MTTLLGVTDLLCQGDAYSGVHDTNRGGASTGPILGTKTKETEIEALPPPGARVLYICKLVSNVCKRLGISTTVRTTTNMLNDEIPVS